jgi:hypothetical protein
MGWLAIACGMGGDAQAPVVRLAEVGDAWHRREERPTRKHATRK